MDILINPLSFVKAEMPFGPNSILSMLVKMLRRSMT